MKNNVKVQDDAQSLQSCVSVSVTDLRIGNFVKDEILWDCEIESIFKQGQIEVSVKNVALDGKIGKRFFILNTDIIKPIPLTKDWILKFGIEKQNGYPYKFLNGYLKIRNGIYFFKYYDLEIEIPFVHSLQNLHYTLKGCDLQIGNLTEH